MKPEKPSHIPVMLKEALHLLQVVPDGTYLDATSGGGGHSEAIAQRLTGGRLIALDRDPVAVACTKERLSPYSGVTVVKANYSDVLEVLKGQGIVAVNGILIDAGMSGLQLDVKERGFSMMADAALDMRMDPTEGKDAATWLAESSYEEIKHVLRNYGDVVPAGRIARAITARCRENRMQRTSDLVAAIRDALDFVTSEPDEIRTCFMAVRMAVNDELNHLESGLRRAAQALAPGGRLVVITFHSGEDRVAKRVFNELSRPVTHLYPDGRVREKIPPVMKRVLSKPLCPTTAEMHSNPRSKSAKIRAIERLAIDIAGHRKP